MARTIGIGCKESGRLFFIAIKYAHAPETLPDTWAFFTSSIVHAYSDAILFICTASIIPAISRGPAIWLPSSWIEALAAAMPIRSMDS